MIEVLLARAGAGDHEAQHELGRRMLAGDGVEENISAALEWLRRSVQSGRAEHLFFLGFVLCAEKPPHNSYREGLQLVLQAAEKGLVGAQYFVASELAQGENVKKDSVEAARWYMKAAQSGHAEAQYNLAMMYLQGEGLEKDLAQARGWLERSAANGEILAMETLANAFAHGHMGFPVDQDSSRKWQMRVQRAREHPT